MRHSSFLVTLILGLVFVPLIADAAWHPDGNHITYAPGYEFLNTMVSDNEGGTIIIWRDPYEGGTRAQRVSGSGISQWPVDGMIMLPPNSGTGVVAASDGADGVFTVWNDDGTRMQHFNGSGAPQWGAEGVFLSEIYNYGLTRIVVDQAGGAIVVFQDWRPGHMNEMYAQRVDPSGTLLWAADGVPLAVLPPGQTWQVMQVWQSIDSDGAGGVVAAWDDFRSQTTRDIYAQRLSPSGQRLWGDEAVLLCAASGYQREPMLATNGSGGAFVAWNDLGQGGVYAQHVDGAGAIQWGVDGFAIHSQGNNEYVVKVVSDGASGAFIAWNDMRNQTYDKYIQHYNAAGVEQWTPGGVAPATQLADRGIFALLPDAQGGVLLGFAQWGESRVQKLSPSGAREWGDTGILIGPGGSMGISDGDGGMIMASERGVGPENVDIFAQRISNTGGIPTAIETPSRSIALRAGEMYPNPFSGTSTVDIELAAPATVRVGVFDVAGRRVRDMSLPASTISQRMEFDGRDGTGKLLPSGVYFCRIEARGESVTRKVVITR